MGRPIKTINEIVNGKSCHHARHRDPTGACARHHGGLLEQPGGQLPSPARARRSEKDLAAHASWASAFPVGDLVRHGVIEPSTSKGTKVASLLSYFG